VFASLGLLVLVLACGNVVDEDDESLYNRSSSSSSSGKDWRVAVTQSSGVVGEAVGDDGDGDAFDPGREGDGDTDGDAAEIDDVDGSGDADGDAAEIADEVEAEHTDGLSL
jgi:hypothetical protein